MIYYKEGKAEGNGPKMGVTPGGVKDKDYSREGEQKKHKKKKNPNQKTKPNKNTPNPPKNKKTPPKEKKQFSRLLPNVLSSFPPQEIHTHK